MKTLVQISDLHFGAVIENVLADLTVSINELRPDLLIVSGDLTQRAKSEQFKQAADYLAQFSMPKIIVPGNHDIPLYNVFDRFVHPLEKYIRYITDEMMPVFIDEEIAVVGLNTARSLTIKDGRLNEKQISEAAEILRNAPASATKIVVTHHPLDALPEFEDDLAENAEKALIELSDAGADLFLSGHLHMGKMTHVHTTKTSKMDKKVLMVQAGTACSTRSRNEINSFNVLYVSQNKIEAIEMTHSLESGFVRGEMQTYVKSGDDWQSEQPTP